MTYWDWGYTASILPRILSAMGVTVTAAFLASIFSLIGGLFIAILKRLNLPILRAPVHWGVEVIRRTPLLIQLYLIFYVLPDFGVLISPLWAGVIGLGIYNSAYMSEVYRAGINAIPVSQWEAARALNIPKPRIWFDIILAQAIPIMIPALANYINIIFKETALLSTISVIDIMGMAKIIGNENYRYLEPITIVGVIYLVICVPAAVGVRWLDNKLNGRSAAAY